MVILIKNLAQYKNETVTVRGWIYNVRSSGKIIFLQVRDGSGFVQAIIEEKKLKNVHGDKAEKVWETASKVTLETSVELTGTVSEHPKKPGVFELHISDVKVYQYAPEYIIGKKEHGPDFLLDNRHLWIRSERQWAILRIRAGIYGYIEEWLIDNRYTRFDSPILTPSACEGTTTLFGVEYFDLGQAFLSQSGQLYLEAAISSLGRVYDFGPVFRAEKSKTRRHLTEFWMMDAEAAFVEHEENMQIQEQLVSFVVKKLQELGSSIEDGSDLGADDETLLTNQYDKPIFIEKYPSDVKAFYMKRDPKDTSVVLCNDLLAPEGYGEIFGGSQREDNYDELLKRIREHGLPEETFRWYLDTRKFGSVPHSGFGIGLERLVAWICGLRHVRETIPFPRMITRKTP